MNQIIKIIPNRLPVIIDAPDCLTKENIESIIEGDYIIGVPHTDLKVKFPELSLIHNVDGGLFELPFNHWATLLHKVVNGGVYGPALLAFSKNGVPVPMTESEASEVREAIEELYDITIERCDE